MAKSAHAWILGGFVIALGIGPFPLVAAPAAAPAATKSPAAASKWQQHQREMFNNSAPADEYFGRMKLSYLEMNNTFRDAAISSGEHTTDTAIAHKVADAEDALDAWAKKFPHDPQLARTYFLATIVERKIWLQANQRRAWDYLNRLAHGFPETFFGKVAKKALAIGFTEHYYAPAVSCAPPPSEPASPSPQPAATALGPGHKVQLMPQACIPLPAPTPTEAPTAAPAESPTASSTEPSAVAPTPSPAAS